MQTKRSIPFFNYPKVIAPHKQEILAVIEDVLTRGAFILQKDLEQFESNLAAFTGAKHAIGVANGTDALIITLRAAGVGPGDEVILPSHTYIATAASVHFVGATPVLVECGRDHMIDPDAVVAAVTSKTKAIMPVQLNGRTCDMDRLQEIADRHGLLIVEDAAQGLGSRYKGKCAGTFGLAGTYSFYPAKVLGCYGDGGAIVTNDDAVAREIRLLRDHGRNEEGDVVAWGLNSRLDNLQAAVLDFKLAQYDQEIDRRRGIAARYHEAFKDIDDLVLPIGPDEEPDHFDVYQNYEVEAGRRDELRAYLKDEGIGTTIQWGGKAVHQFNDLGLQKSLPFTERVFARCFLLPMNTMLTDDDVGYICSAVRRFYGLER